MTVDLDRIFVREGGTYTSAGVSAGIDLALALIEEDHGRKLALHGLVNHTMMNLVTVIGIPMAALALQAIIAIQLMRAAYIRRGWREGY